jgi:hypothetical protein
VNLVVFIHSLGRGGAERVTAISPITWRMKAGTSPSSRWPTARLDCYELHRSIHRVSLNLDEESANPLVAIANNVRRIRAVRAVLREKRPDAALGMMNTASVLLVFASRDLASSTSVPNAPILRLHEWEGHGPGCAAWRTGDCTHWSHSRPRRLAGSSSMRARATLS